MEVTTHSPEETKALATKVLDQNFHLITLAGDLGAGKTTLTQGIGELLKLDRLTSPTFTLIKEYELGDNPYKFSKLYHIDLYRLTTEEEVNDLGLVELWSNKKNLLLIEWPKIISSLPPHLELNLETLGPEKRRITIQPK